MRLVGLSESRTAHTAPVPTMTNPRTDLALRGSFQPDRTGAATVGKSWQELDNLESSLTMVDAAPPIPENGPQLYLVLGSYRELANAENHLARAGDTQISPVVINDTRHFRVVLGPLGASISTLARSQTSQHNPGSWPVWLCPGTLRAPPCMTQVAQL